MADMPPSKPAGNWKTLLICPDSKMSNHILPLISQQVALGPIFELPSYPYRTVLAETLAGRAPYLCFLDVSSDPERALSTIQALLQVHPSLQIVALLTETDPDLILRCLRQGAAEFLVEPFTADQLRPALEKLARMRPHANGAPHGSGRVICVAPAKGACGATTIAIHLAIQLRKLGLKRVLLADLDLLTGTIAFSLKLKSPYSFLDAIQRAATLDESVWKALIIQCGGVDVLLAPENPADGIQEVQDPSPIVDVSRTLYDAVILDTASVYGDWGIALAQLCDDMILVTTNELPALQAAQRALTYLEHHQVPRTKIKLLVNRFGKDVGLSREAIETALRTEVYQLLPSDYEAIQKAVIEGKTAPPQSAFGRSIAALAGELMGGKHSSGEMPRRANALSGLLSWLTKKPVVSR